MRQYLIQLIIGMLPILLPNNAKAIHAYIIESQSYLSSHIMDTKWQTILNGMGHTSVIAPQTTLDNTSFFSAADLLIISSGSINLPANRVAIIQQYLLTGKPVYIQGEYNCAFSANQAFSTLVNALGGTFTWGGTTNGILTMSIIGSHANTPTVIQNPVLPNYNFACHGTGCGISYFLERAGLFYGYFFCAPNPDNGRMIQVTDQDWIISNTNDTLMRNMVAHLITPSLCNSTNFTPTQLGNDTTLCAGDTLLLNASNSNATYLWQDGSTNPTLPVFTSGLYWVQVSNNCGVFSDTIQVSFNPPPTVQLGKDTTLCSGQSLFLNATVAGASYMWQDGSTNPGYLVTTPGNYSVNVNLHGCVASDTIIVSYQAPPVVSLGNDAVLCEGEMRILDASTNGATYVWQDGSTNAIFSVTQSGVYSVIVTTACGVSGDTVQFLFNPKPVVQLGNDTSICRGNTVQLDANTNDATIAWSTGASTSVIDVNESGLYWVQVTKGNCVVRDSIQINVFDKPQFSLGNDTTLCAGDRKLLSLTIPDATFQWQDGSKSSSYMVTKKGKYWVTADFNGCASSDTILVDYYTESCSCELFVPNAFSPNRDGINDEFRFIVNANNIELREFIIADRWGGVAFSTQQVNDSWNGRTLGGDAAVGTYYYFIRYLCKFTGIILTVKGDVTLIR